MSQGEAKVEVKPIRENLFVESSSDGLPKLFGSKCKETGEVFYPAELMNPTTQRMGTIEPYEIDGAGKLTAFTTISRGLPGFESPYSLAVVTLNEGPSLIAQLHDWQEAELRTGMNVELVIETVKTDRDGTKITGPKFRPVAN